MKMKEVTIWLSVVGFLQLVFLACVGGLVSEILKSERSILLIVLSVMLAVITLCTGVAIYLKIYKQISEQ